MSMHPMTDQCSICFSRSAPRRESGNWSVGGHLVIDHRSPLWVICLLTSLPPDLSMVTWLLTPDHRSRRSSPWSLCHLVHVSPCEWSTWSSAADVIDYRWPIGSLVKAIFGPMRCKSLRSSSLALRSSSLFVCNTAKSFWYRFWLDACLAWTSAIILFWLALDAATAYWTTWMVSMSCCMETMSPPSSADAPCLVFLMLLGGSQHDCQWDLVLSGPTVGAKCSHRLTQSSLTSKADGGSSCFLVVFALSLGGREWLRWNRGGPTC